MNDGYDSLSNDSKYLLLMLYKMYIERRKDGTSKSKSRSFEDVPYIHTNLMPQWSEEDILDTVNELVRQKFLTAVYGGNTAFEIELSTTGVSKMEHRFKDSANNVINALSKIKEFIPFI